MIEQPCTPDFAVRRDLAVRSLKVQAPVRSLSSHGRKSFVRLKSRLRRILSAPQTR